jgi:hypothetical protein
VVGGAAQSVKFNQVATQPGLRPVYGQGDEVRNKAEVLVP